MCQIIPDSVLFTKYPLDDLQRDAVTLLLFGSAYSDDDLEVASTLAKCEIGNHLGKPDSLAAFIKQRYIWVSRLVGGNILNYQIFEEMLIIYDKSVVDMKLLGELDWYWAARQTQKRLVAYLQGKLNEAPYQLARECHADLQGYVKVKFDSDIMDANDCYKKGCFCPYFQSDPLS